MNIVNSVGFAYKERGATPITNRRVTSNAVGNFKSIDYNIVINLFLLLMFSFSIASCKLMPYRNDFDCPVPLGLKCKSLYEVNKMADQGIFYPDKGHKLDRCCNKYSKR